MAPRVPQPGVTAPGDELEISIVMPCLNEAETLRDCIDEALEAMRACGVSGEVIIADNGSTDGSQEIAVAAGARVVPVAERGYGNALIGGINSARSDYVMMGDADGSYNFGELGHFLERLRLGADLVMGCRLPKGGGTIEPGAMPWKHRWIGNPILSGVGKIFFRSPVDDFHCGLRAFRREAILGLNLRCSGMEFASEMVVKAAQARLKMDQVPITLRPDGRSRPPHLNSWRDGWRHLKFLLLFSPKWLFFYPGLTMCVVGIAGFAALATGPVTIGGVSFDTNTMLLCATSIIVGFQAIFFALFTQAFSMHIGLRRPDTRFRKLLEKGPVEWGAVSGSLLLVAGVGMFIYAFLKWQRVDFGPLSYADSLRLVIPAVTAMTVGVQTIFSGFVFGTIGLIDGALNSSSRT
ncbi:putative glycosyltransferase [Halioglobus japonicus]|nr:putative glycosyltransferase [Halioglobus japonicus]